MPLPGISANRQQSQAGALERIAILAARLLDCEFAAVIANGKTRACTIWRNEPELALIADALRERIRTTPALWFHDLWMDASLARLNGRLRFCAVARIDDAGVLIVAGREPRDSSLKALRHLSDLASLAANDLDLERRRVRLKDSQDARRSDEQLLDKTLELTKFNEDLRQIHRLSTSTYASLDQMLADYLDTGRAIFGLAFGAITQVRGRYGTIVASSSDRIGATAELDSETSAAVAEDRQTLAIQGGDHPSYLGAPIIVDDEVWGILSFTAPHRRWRDFATHEIELIELMAKSIARSLLERRMLAARRNAEALETDRGEALEMIAKNEPLDRVMRRIEKLVERQVPNVAASIDLTGRDPDAAASVVIRSGAGERLGTLSVVWKIAVYPREAPLDILEMAAQLAAIAIEHRRLTDRLEFQARHDVLTGLANRELFTSILDTELAAARRSGRMVAVAFVDLDRFKQINDHWGHAAGDIVLRETARRISQCLQPGEAAGRLGGDEFVVMLTAAQSREESAKRTQEILEAVRAPIELEGQSVAVTASIGLSLYPQCLHAGTPDTAEALLAGADQAMYQVKNNGKNGVLLSNAEASGVRATNLQLEYSLDRALRNGEFRLYFQPVFDIRQGAGIALEEMEVLLGWDHPELGPIGPAQFIPIAEQCGRIAQIGAWVLREACRQSAEWRRRGLRAVRLAINVSPLQFEEPGFVELVEEVLAESGLPPGAIELELTESAIVKDIQGALPKIERLRELGVPLTLDDFGTGYSALSYLCWMPVSTLKIDRSFVAGMATSDHMRTLVQAIIAMAHSMNLTVVAEGVENESQFELLQQQRCDLVQGHLLSEPLPVEKMEHWLRREARAAAG